MKAVFSQKHYFISIGVVSVVALLCYPFSNWIGYRSVALLLLLTVSIMAMRLTLYPVLIAAALSALIWDFFFIPPHFTLTVGSGEDSLLLIMYFIVACLSGVFNHKLRQVEHITRQKEERETVIQLYHTLFDSLSHELRTPIATILGAIDALAENEEKLSKQNVHDLFAAISAAALRLQTQIENLLNTSRLDSGVIRANMEWCDVQELIYNTIHKARKNNLNHHKVVFQLDNQLPLVKLDYGLMEQVIHNLFVNASIYSPMGTQITVSAYIATALEGEFDAKKERVQNDSVSYKLVIKVADEGNGIPDSEMNMIFERFYRLKYSKTGGTGLGLFIVKGFLAAQGGEIRVVNLPHGGATFIIELPTPIILKNVSYESF